MLNELPTRFAVDLLRIIYRYSFVTPSDIK